MNVSTITLLFEVIPGYMFQLKLSHPQAYVNSCYQILCTLWDPVVFTFVEYI